MPIPPVHLRKVQLQRRGAHVVVIKAQNRLEQKFVIGDQGELFNALSVPIPPPVPPDGSDPVEALGELIQMGDAPACTSAVRSWCGAEPPTAA